MMIDCQAILYLLSPTLNLLSSISLQGQVVYIPTFPQVMGVPSGYIVSLDDYAVFLIIVVYEIFLIILLNLLEHSIELVSNPYAIA